MIKQLGLQAMRVALDPPAPRYRWLPLRLMRYQ
jgi:hypothetical protein